MYYNIECKLPYQNDLDYFESFIYSIRTITSQPIEISAFKNWRVVEIDLDEETALKISHLPMVNEVRTSGDRGMVSEDQRKYI